MRKPTIHDSIRIVSPNKSSSNSLLLHLSLSCLVLWVLAQLCIHTSIARITAAINDDGGASQTGVSRAEQQRLLALVALSSSSSSVSAVVKDDQNLNSVQPPGKQQLGSNSTVRFNYSNNKNDVATQHLTNVFEEQSSWAQPSKHYVIDPTDLWEQPSSNRSSSALPQWMIQYFRFHKEQRQQSMRKFFTKAHDDNHEQQQHQLTVRYLYVTCLAEYRKCGGAADRLLPLPFLVQVAAQSHRVLLLQWTKPASLEAFLLPPLGGVDWRVGASTQVSKMLQAKGVKAGDQETIVELSQNASIEVVQVKFQSHDHGSAYYNRCVQSSEPDFETVFSTVWRIFFTPTLPLQEQIAATLQTHHLVPGNYVAAHLRALYGVATREESQLETMAENAVRCAVQLQQQQPSNDDIINTDDPIVYFASDSILAVQKATLYGAARGVHVTSRSSSSFSSKKTQSNAASTKTKKQQQDPLHLDKTPNWRKRPASDFFDIFVDLYVLGLSRCVAIGMGGYGKFASLISPTATSNNCVMVHMNATDLADCAALPPVNKKNKHGQQHHTPKMRLPAQSIFLPPMPTRS